jgi:hypothetical protein
VGLFGPPSGQNKFNCNFFSIFYFSETKSILKVNDQLILKIAKKIKIVVFQLSFLLTQLQHIETRLFVSQFLNFHDPKTTISESFLKNTTTSIAFGSRGLHFGICEICGVSRKKKLQQVIF